jgi:hypothetical protein
VQHDCFDDPASDWGKGDRYEEANYSYEPSGTYQVRSKSTKWSIQSTSPFGSKSEYVVKVDARTIGNSPAKDFGIAFGITGSSEWRATDPDQILYLGIDPEGKFRVQKFNQSTCRSWCEVIPWTSHSAIKKGINSNSLTIVCKMNKAYLYADGIDLWPKGIDTPCEGEAGVLLWHDNFDKVVQFDNFAVCKP